MNRGSGGTGQRALGDALATLLDAPLQMATAFADALGQRGARGCEIPPPCWEPRRLGTCRLVLAPGSTGTIRVHVTNCDWTRQVVTITATGRLASIVKLEPTTLVIDMQEQATFTVTVHVPDGAKPGETFSGGLLVRGCLNHYARIEVRVAECAGQNCCDIHARDCPDHIHHWYDHFYCPRPCRNTSIDRNVTHG